MLQHDAQRGGGERENAEEGGIERGREREDRGPVSSGGRSDLVRRQNSIPILLLYFHVLLLCFIFQLQVQTNTPLLISVPFWFLSLLCLYIAPPPNSPAVNMSPFPSLLWAPVSNHNHIKVQPLAGWVCVRKRARERERETKRQQERTLCCIWTQKPHARVNPSLPLSVRGNRGWAVLSVFPSRSALAVMNEGWLAQSQPSIYTDK